MTLRRWSADPRYLDAVLALLLSPLTLLATMSLSSEAGLGALPWGLLLGLLFTVPLFWRRSRPEAATAVIVAAHLIQLFTFRTILPADVTAPLMLYAVVVYGEGRRQRWWLSLALLGGVAGGVSWGWVDNSVTAANTVEAHVFRVAMWVIGNSLVVLVAWFSAQTVRQRRLRMSSLQDRADALERERDKAVQLAAEEERSRIAREMHDIVAHSLSVIVVQADGAGYLATNPGAGDAEARLQAVTRALQTISETSRSALAETRRLVGVLRRGEEIEVSPAATLDQIADLVSNLSSAGVQAGFVELGDRATHPPLTAGAELAAYRVVQEALTNVVKHAGPGTSVTVQVAHSADGLSVQVSDTGVSTPGSADSTGPESGPGGGHGSGHGSGPESGHGLIGMRERVAAFGGTLQARPRQGGGFEVRAHLPSSFEGDPL